MHLDLSILLCRYLLDRVTKIASIYSNEAEGK